MTGKKLVGLKIMVVEDEYLVALDLKQMIESLGATVLGPIARATPALEMARRQQLDGALLDVSLVGETSVIVAEELLARGIPVILTSGYDISALPIRLQGLPYLPKPVDMRALRRIAVTALLRDKLASLP